MMVQNREFTYQETASFQAVQLPYKGGLRMEVLLPAANSNPQQLLESLKTPGNWQGNLQPAFADREGTLILPKFKMEYAVELNSPLKALGMNRAFGEERCDLLGFTLFGGFQDTHRGVSRQHRESEGDQNGNVA